MIRRLCCFPVALVCCFLAFTVLVPLKGDELFGNGPPEWFDTDHSLIKGRMKSTEQPGKWDSVLKDGKLVGFEVIGEIPDPGKVPALNEGDNQCVSCAMTRGIWYLAGRNAPNQKKVEGYRPQGFANNMHHFKFKCLITESVNGQTADPGPYGTFETRFMEAKKKMLKELAEKLKVSWPSNIHSEILKKVGQTPNNWGTFFETLAAEINAGNAIEVRASTGDAQTAQAAGGHAMMLAKVLKFENGRFGLVFVDDRNQGDGKENNTLRGPFIFDPQTGECLSKENFKIKEVMKEYWKQA